MPGVVCAIRGGPDSRSTLEVATALAVEVEQPLHLLYVINVGFLAQTSSSRIRSLLEEMGQMGEMILAMARQRAEAAGAEVETAVRTGEVAEEIVTLCRELDADYVVVGRPVPHGAPNVFSFRELQQTIARIRESCRAAVRVVGEEAP